MLGFELQYSKVDMDQYTISDGEKSEYLSINKKGAFWAVYAQDQVKLSNYLAVTLGMHHDHYDSFGGITNPRLALVFSPTSNTVVKMTYGKAFKAPTLYERYYTDDDTTVGNESLLPEVIQGCEIGIEKSFGLHFWGRMSVYHKGVENLIIQSTNEEGLFQFQNKDNVVAKGAEFELKADSLNHTSFYLNGNYQLSIYKDTKKELGNSPKFSSNFGISHSLWDDKCILSLEARYLGKRLSREPDITIPSFMIINLSVHIEKIVKNLRMCVRVYNVLNKKYYDPGGGEHRMVMIEQDGRKFLLEICCCF